MDGQAQEERIKLLEKNLQGLLNDEDVKSLPCYKLLFEKYGPSGLLKFTKCVCGVLYKNLTKHEESKKHCDYLASLVLSRAVEGVEGVVEIPDDPVYQVSIKGVVYFNRGVNLYDKKTLKPVGYISSAGFVMKNKTHEISPIRGLASIPGYEERFYMRVEQEEPVKVYRKISDTVAHVIGVYENNQINLYVDE